MLDVLTGLLIAGGFCVSGFLASDWRRRTEERKAALDALAELRALDASHREHLAKIHELDHGRAAAIADLLGRVEVIEQRYEMLKVSSANPFKAPRT